jgi:hypothetical protein
MVMIGNAREEIQQGPPAFDVLELARAAMAPKAAPAEG